MIGFSLPQKQSVSMRSPNKRTVQEGRDSLRVSNRDVLRDLPPTVIQHLVYRPIHRPENRLGNLLPQRPSNVLEPLLLLPLLDPDQSALLLDRPFLPFRIHVVEDLAAATVPDVVEPEREVEEVVVDLGNAALLRPVQHLNGLEDGAAGLGRAHDELHVVAGGQALETRVGGFEVEGVGFDVIGLVEPPTAVEVVSVISPPGDLVGEAPAETYGLAVFDPVGGRVRIGLEDPPIAGVWRGGHSGKEEALSVAVDCERG